MTTSDWSNSNFGSKIQKRRGDSIVFNLQPAKNGNPGLVIFGLKQKCSIILSLHRPSLHDLEPLIGSKHGEFKPSPEIT